MSENEKNNLKPVEFGVPVTYDECKEEISSIQRRIIEDGGPFLPDKSVANVIIPVFRGDTVIGFGFLFVRDDYVDIMRMVDPDEQGQGVGKLLLIQLEKWTKGIGVEEVHSYILDSKQSAQDAMEKAGYVISRREQGRILYVKKL